jgi:hypothetical protein
MVKRNRKTAKRSSRRKRNTRRSQRGGDNNYQRQGNAIYKARYPNKPTGVQVQEEIPKAPQSWWNKSWAQIKAEQNYKRYGPPPTGGPLTNAPSLVSGTKYYGAP